MRAHSIKRMAFGLLLFAAACSEPPAAPEDVTQVSGPTLDVKPQSATEALLNDALNEIFEPGERNDPNSTLAEMKGAATAKPQPDVVAALAAALSLLQQAEDEIMSPGEDDLLERLAFLITQYLNEQGITGMCVISPSGGDCITENADAGVSIPLGALDAPALITITRKVLGAGERCLDTDNPQSAVDCWEFTSTEPFLDSVLVGQCINTDFVKPDQVPLIRLGAQDNGVVVTLPADYDLLAGDLDFLTGCTPVVISAAEPTGLFQYAQRGWQQLKSQVTSLFGPTPLQAGTVVLATGGIGGKKGSFSDIGPMLPSEMSIYQGNGQTGGIGTEAPVDPAVKVIDANGDLVEGASIHFQVLSGGGSVTPLTVYSDVNGIAKVDSWILGNPGANVLEAYGAGIGDPTDGGPFVDPVNVVTHDIGRVEFNAEAILLAGGELVVVNDINLFSDLADLADNSIFINNLVDFSNSDRPMASKVWFDRGRNSKCFDFGGCVDGELDRMEEIIEAVTGVGSIEYHNSSSKNRIGTIPGDVKVLFLWNPTVSFGKSEVANIGTFLETGGRVVLVGEQKDFVGANGIRAANKLLSGLGADMRVRSDNLHCGLDPTETTNINPASDIMSGVDVISINCVSSMTPGVERLFSEPLLDWLAGVAIDLDADN